MSNQYSRNFAPPVFKEVYTGADSRVLELKRVIETDLTDRIVKLERAMSTVINVIENIGKICSPQLKHDYEILKEENADLHFRIKELSRQLDYYKGEYRTAIKMSSFYKEKYKQFENLDILLTQPILNRGKVFSICSIRIPVHVNNI